MLLWSEQPLDALQSEEGEPFIARFAGRAGSFIFLAALLALGGAAMRWFPNERSKSGTARYEQLTGVQDAASSPSLSPDGRLLAFVQGSGGTGRGAEVYVRTPDGVFRQLTRDGLFKTDPVFSPDGSSVVYSVQTGLRDWEVWEAPVAGGAPRLRMQDAAGLSWIGQRWVIFSDSGSGGRGRVRIGAADFGRPQSRTLYEPDARWINVRRAHPSPDGNWLLVTESDNQFGTWRPCRLVPMDGRSAGLPVGPPGGGCRAAAWTPDGRWMYLNVRMAGEFHVWRQRFLGSSAFGEPEQVTEGTAEEEGISIAPDGLTFVTAIGQERTSVWLRDWRGERRVSLHRTATHPALTPDGKTVVFQVRSPDAGDGIWATDIKTGHTRPVMEGLPITGFGTRTAFDISRDGRRLVVCALDEDGKPRLWVVALDGSGPPAMIPGVEGVDPKFSGRGEVIFCMRVGNRKFAYRVRPDGSGLRYANEFPITGIRGLSPDGEWLVVTGLSGESDWEGTLAIPLKGGAALRIFDAPVSVKWSPDQSYLFLEATKSYSIPLPRGQAFPEVPVDGFESEKSLARIHGVQVIESPEVAPGPTVAAYAFVRHSVRRNIYRVPIP